MGRMLRNAILASALALAACHAPVRPSPDLRKTNPAVEKVMKEKDQRHLCESVPAIPGGLKGRTYVMLQYHTNHLTDEKSPMIAQSQIFIFKVLADLVRKYDIKTIFLEGVDRSHEFGHGGEEKQAGKEAKAIFLRCTNEIAGIVRSKKPELFEKRVIGEVCLYFVYSLGVNFTHLYLFSSMFPETKMKGFERKEDPTYKKYMGTLDEYRKQMKDLEERVITNLEFASRLFSKEGLRDDPDVIKGRKLLIEMARHREFINSGRSAFAVETAIANPLQNNAIVIGAGHRDSMIRIISRIPFESRPSFHFISHECASKFKFITPPEKLKAIIDLTGLGKEE